MTVPDKEKIRKANRLIREKSPYLLQHAYNPVDWHPWGEEAFEKAKREDKPIFLSIGYSTCHWCHVMERESFEDEEVGRLLNENFIAVKVDREERPDIDHVYMTVCQGLTGHGGWPLTIIMTPDKEAFFAATYLPKESRGGLTGLMDLLPHISSLWKQERQRIVNSGEKIKAWLRKMEKADAVIDWNQEIVDRGFAQLAESFDKAYGGFGPAPKFPAPHNLLFLMRYYYYHNEGRALAMVEKTLECMYRGGIYDHIGFGFARYSTDRQWLVPHFEKMLYDNALLAMAYLEAYQLTGRAPYARAAREIFAYVLRDMTSPAGGFYSAEDADSEGEEGKFYTWSRDEVLQVLGEAGESYCDAYDISMQGNFEGRNIPNLIRASTQLREDSKERFQEQHARLFACREKRVHPFKDDKILSGWNGLMIAALAMGARILNDAQYLQAAENSANFVLQEMRRRDGRLLHATAAGKRLILPTPPIMPILYGGCWNCMQPALITTFCSMLWI
jgi:uncharacterized protein YyaL (SSP411 family)